jgi:hypothetical protein
MSSPLKLYHQIHEALKGLGKWGRPELVETLAYLMVGIFMSRDVRLNRIAEEVPLAIQEESVAQRFRRWLKNPQVDERTIYDPVVRALLNSLRHTRLRIQVDRTLVEGRFNVLMLSVFYRKRALPLVWKVLPHPGSSGYLDWAEMLSHLADLVPENAQLVLLADREFGQPELVKLLGGYEWDYCLRVKSNYWVYLSEAGMWFQLSELAPAAGGQRFLNGLGFTHSKALAWVNFALARAKDGDDPWFIVTNLPASQRVLREYARRFACEELFSDIKSRGFNLENSQLQHRDRFSRLLIAIALLYLWVIAVARRVRLLRLDRTLTYRWDEHRLSLFQIGRRWIKKQLTLARPPVPEPDFSPWILSYEK